MPEGGFEISFDLEVEHSPDDVFAFLVDTARLRELDDALVGYGPGGPLSAGSTGWFRHRRGGMTARTTFAVTEFEPARRLVVQITGMGYAMTESAFLEESPVGTHARFVDRVWPTSVPGRLLVALSGGIMRRDLAKRATRMRALLGRDAARS